MRTRLTLWPGQPGTRRLVAEYGARLVCVRYRYDREKGKRYKTVELIVEEIDWHPGDAQPEATAVVSIRVGREETMLRQQVKRAGGKWDPEQRVWKLSYGQVVKLGLRERVVEKGDTGER